MYRDELEALRTQLSSLEEDQRGERRRRLESVAERQEAERACAKERRVATQLEQGTPRTLRCWVAALTLVALVVPGVTLYVWSVTKGSAASAAARRSQAAAARDEARHDLERARDEAVVRCRRREALPVAPPGTPARVISSNDIVDAQRRHGAALKECYRRALGDDEALTDVKAELTVQLGAAGRVQAVTITGVDAPAFVACLKRTVQGWVLREDLDAQSFTFPVVFRGR